MLQAQTRTRSCRRTNESKVVVGWGQATGIHSRSGARVCKITSWFQSSGAVYYWRRCVSVTDEDSLSLQLGVCLLGAALSALSPLGTR